MADGRHSVTHYETLEAHRFASLLEIHLETGRTHQIRVHMAALKHPCVGDLTYGADPVLAQRVGPGAAVAARRTPRLRAPRRRASTSSTSRPTPTTSSTRWTSSVTPTDGIDGDDAADLTLRPASADDADGAGRAVLGRPPAASRRCRRRSTPRRGRHWFREVLGLARHAADARARGLGGRARRRRRRLRRCSTRTGWTRSTSVPTSPGRASAPRCSTWSRRCVPTASRCGSSRPTSGARRSTRATAWSCVERTDGSGNEEQAPDLRMAWLGRPAGRLPAADRRARRRLAAAQRAGPLTAAAQAQAGAGHAGRDAPGGEIVARMALAPDLGSALAASCTP